jgi:type II secretory pathway component PulF
MYESFQQLMQSHPGAGLVMLALGFLLYVVAGLLPCGALIYLGYWLLTVPMRRNERARCFLDLAELGLRSGRAPEAAIIGASKSHDVSLGARFHLVAAYLEQGVRLSEALDLEPRLLPPQVRAMLRAGERIGDLARVLPACRQLLRDGSSQVRGALNYVLVLAFAVTPAMIFVPAVVNVKVLPKFTEIFASFGPGQLPAFTRLVFGVHGYLLPFQFAVLLVLWSLVIAYLGGPRVRGWFRDAAPRLSDALLFRLPWRRKRLQRDFSAMLAVLLDAGVPEAEAVGIAAESTANETLIRRAAATRQLLSQGIKMPEAIRAMDSSREFSWRLANALQRGGGFLKALAGWHDALDAKAFQLEQTAAQVATTALVLLNGLIVGSFVIAVFLALVSLLYQATLW